MTSHRTTVLQLITLIVLLAAARTRGDDAPDPREPLPGHSLHGEGFSEGPRRRLPLIPGCGEVHFPVTTSSPEAQQFFDQGVGQLHGFWYWEAERSFRTVLALDPDCVMAHWGLAMANVENEPRAREFLAQVNGQALEKATPRERAWVEAAKKLFGEKKKAEGETTTPGTADTSEPPPEPPETDDQKKARRKAFLTAVEAIALDHPDDVEPRAMVVGFSWINKGKGLELSSPLAVDALGRQVLDRNPRHPVHHYLIHLWDHDRAAEALRSAALCGPAAPGIAHMWHMPGHIYSGLERWHDAAWQQEAAARVDHAQMLRAHVFPDQIHNFAHNSEWLIRNLNHLGQAGDAVGIAVDMIGMPRIPRSKEVTPDPEQSFKEEGSCWQFGRDRLFETILRWELWDEAARLAETPALDPGEEFEDRWRREQLMAFAAYGRGDREAAAAAMARLETILADERAARSIAADEAEAKARGEGKPAAEISAAMAEAMRPFSERIEKLAGPLAELRIHAALAEGSLEAAREQCAALTDAHRDSIDKSRLAMIHLALGDIEKAVEVARAQADAAKAQLQPHALLAFLQWQAGTRDEALATFERVRSLAATADPELPALARLAPLAEAAGVAGDWRIPATSASDLGERPDLDTLGPLRWQAWQAGSWTATSASGETVTSGAYAGRPHVILLTLGMACEHCNEQVKAFTEAASRFEAAGLPVLVISTDSPEDIAGAGDRLPFLALSGVDGEAFRALGAWDDFENTPLHATCYISADGRMRWQHMGYEPFMLPEFLLDEIGRLEAMPESLR
jgi:peroxiredoxin